MGRNLDRARRRYLRAGGNATRQNAETRETVDTLPDPSDGEAVLVTADHSLLTLPRRDTVGCPDVPCTYSETTR